MIFGINNTRDISKLSQISRAVTYNNFEISLVVFRPKITTNHAITYTNSTVVPCQLFGCEKNKLLASFMRPNKPFSTIAGKSQNLSDVRSEACAVSRLLFLLSGVFTPVR